MSPRTNTVSLDDHDDLTEPDTNLTAIRPTRQPTAAPTRPRAGLVPVPMPARSSQAPRTPVRTSQVQVSPGRVTSPPPVPRASISARPIGRPLPTRAAPQPTPRVVAAPSEPTRAIAPAAVVAASTPPSRAIPELTPAHSERRWSEPPVLFAPPTSTRGEPTLELAARESRHSFAPPAVSDSAARFLPWYWRAWLTLLARLEVPGTGL